MEAPWGLSEQEGSTMSSNKELRFSANHVYVLKQASDEALLGFSDFGQEHTSRVSTIELPNVGQRLIRGEPFATIEAIKAVVELRAPVGGVIVSVNDRLRAEPWLINTDPYGEGWIVRVHLDDPRELDDLMDEATYTATARWEVEF
jgi:glycine cleavage system H protein